MILALLTTAALADIDPKCAGIEKPRDYDEQTQTDFLQNRVALSTTFSALHAPVPHEAGHGAIGLDFLVLPPLSCEQRYVFDHTKTEDTNVTPMVPRPTLTFAFDGPGELVPYGGFAYIPPVPIFGTRNAIVSGEFGVGAALGKVQLGGRVHATLQKTVGDIATAFDTATEPAVPDLYIASTFGLDASAGYALGTVTPYASVGFTDVSSYFFVGDSNAVSYNLHPYAGVVFAAGADALVKDRIRLGAEFYGAPGGYSKPTGFDWPSPSAPARYGSIYTARFRVAYEL